MNNVKIDTPDKALALANVINPGGHRLNPDGSMKPGLEGHETNCAIVAIATAAFMQDGTEVGAFCAPSALLINGNDFLVGFIASSKTLSGDYPPRIQIVPQEDELKFYDDEDFQKTFGLNDVVEQLREIVSEYPGHSFLVHGRGEDHHWFNITSTGEIIDVQLGAIGEQLLLGQRIDQEREQFGVYDGTRRFTYLDIYPVDLDLDGPTLIASAEGLHQFNSMVDLARHIDSETKKLLLADQIEALTPLTQIIDEILDPYVAAQLQEGQRETGSLHNAQTAEWFNTFCNQRIEALNSAGIDGGKIVHDILSNALTEKPDLKVSEDVTQTWLAESSFREAGSVEKTPSVVKVFADRCPLINDAIRQTLDAVPTPSPSIER